MTRQPTYDLMLDHRGHTLHVTGSICPASPEEGPSYDCGGVPSMPAYVDEFNVWLVRGKKERLLDDPKDRLLDALQDEILEKAGAEDDEDAR